MNTARNKINKSVEMRKAVRREEGSSDREREKEDEKERQRGSDPTTTIRKMKTRNVALISGSSPPNKALAFPPLFFNVFFTLFFYIIVVLT